jgi:hypothetical protein
MYTKWPSNRPSGHKIYQRLPLQDPPKLTHLIMYVPTSFNFTPIFFAPRLENSHTKFQGIIVRIQFQNFDSAEVLVCFIGKNLRNLKSF